MLNSDLLKRARLMIDFASVSTCDYADALPREQFCDYAIRPLFSPVARIAGPAFTVLCEPGDHLMLHVAIYEANPGDIIVAQADDAFALAGGNVCAIAQARGIKGFVIDGVIRDLQEVRAMQFPVFARGVIPKPGSKNRYSPLQQPIRCGGVTVNPGDIVVADEEGIAVIPSAEAATAHSIATQRATKDASMSLEQWQQNHQQTVATKLKAARGLSE